MKFHDLLTEAKKSEMKPATPQAPDLNTIRSEIRKYKVFVNSSKPPVQNDKNDFVDGILSAIFKLKETDKPKAKIALSYLIKDVLTGDGIKIDPKLANRVFDNSDNNVNDIFFVELIKGYVDKAVEQKTRARFNEFISSVLLMGKMLKNSVAKKQASDYIKKTFTANEDKFAKEGEEKIVGKFPIPSNLKSVNFNSPKSVDAVMSLLTAGQ